MRIANLAGRLVIVTADRAVDVHLVSDGRFGPDVQAVYERWDEFVEWAGGADLPAGQPFDPAQLGAPAPAPRQILAVGLNYGDHATESGYAIPEGDPPIFTKFVSSVAGPYGEIVLPAGGHTDWEVELVAVIGRRAYQVDVAAALSHVAGYTVGQDISERRLQLAASPPQFSLGKSFPGFGPVGPWVVTPDELDDPDDLEIACWVNDELVQSARTSEMLLPVPVLLERVSAVTPLLPGDLVFTGTPAGVGERRDPPRFLEVGDVVVTKIRDVGDLRTTLVARER